MSQPTEQNSVVLDIARKAIETHLDDHLGNIGSTSVAMEVLRDLSLAGYVICRMHGGDEPHTGTCPTCGCTPVQPD